MNIGQMIEDVQAGNEDPLRALKKLRDLKNDIENAIKYIDDYAIEEALKRKGETIDGKRVNYVSGGRLFDFKNIGAWREKRAELDDIEDFYKNLYLAKEKQSGFDAVNMDTGEIEVLPIVTYKKDCVKFEKI